MDDLALIWVSRILLFTFVSGLLTFVALYFFRSNWRTTIPGKYFLYFMSTLTVIFLYLLVTPLLVHYHGRFYINILLALILNFGAWRMTFILFKIQQEDRRNTKDDEV